MGVDVVCVHVMTHFLRNVEDNLYTYSGLDKLNSFASQFAFIYDHINKCIELHSSFYAHSQNLGWVKRHFLMAASLQVSSAQMMADLSIKMFRGSEVDISPHPDNGYREEPDDLVNLLESHYIRRDNYAPIIDIGIFQEAVDMLLPDVQAKVERNGLTVKIPFFITNPEIVQPAQKRPEIETFTFRIDSEKQHPLLGRGLMMCLKVPPSFSSKYGLVIARMSNVLEIVDRIPCHINGAWKVDARSRLTYTTFLPIADECKSLDLVNLVISNSIRSQWAGRMIGRKKNHSEHAECLENRDHHGYNDGS
jgi:hypothetical protein